MDNYQIVGEHSAQILDQLSSIEGFEVDEIVTVIISSRRLEDGWATTTSVAGANPYNWARRAVLAEGIAALRMEDEASRQRWKENQGD